MPGLDDLLLPEGSRIVHIGPHKTGTTAVQGAFADARPRLGEHHLHYPGRGWQVFRPALALTGSKGPRGVGQVDAQAWERLVREIESHGPDRTLISSESLSRAEPDRIARLRADLDPERVQIVAMVRRYDKLLPSLWQQRVVNGYDGSWDGYVDRILGQDGHPFWKHFGMLTLARRWAQVVGADRVTVVVVNDEDRGWLLRVMEGLTGLPDGFLVPGTDARYENRSLSWAEAEMIRRTNLEFRGRGWSDAALRHYLRFGVKIALKPFPIEPSEGKPRVSPGRYQHLEEITRRDWAGLRALGVRIVGELGWLLPPRTDRTAEPLAGTTAVEVPREPLLLAAPKVVAAVASVAVQAALPQAPALGEAPDRQPPEPVAPSAPAAQQHRRWWRRTAPRTVVVPPLDQALAAWERHLAAGGTEDLAALLPSVSIEVPAAGEIVVAAGTARSYDELAVVRDLAERHPGRAATLLAWLRASQPQPSYGVPAKIAAWADERAAEIRAAIGRHGLEVVGDLDALEAPAAVVDREPRLGAAGAGLLLAGMVAGSHEDPAGGA